MVIKASSSAFADTIESPMGAIEGRGRTLFARIDHACAAGEAGLELYRDPRELAEAYQLQGREPVLEQMAGLLGALADEAAG